MNGSYGFPRRIRYFNTDGGPEAVYCEVLVDGHEHPHHERYVPESGLGFVRPERTFSDSGLHRFTHVNL